MRVSIFFDGKNFYAGWCEKTAGSRIDFAKLSKWLVDRVKGDHLWGAYYYTGVDENPTGGDDALGGFLTALETVPGYFVKRFRRQSREIRCPHCSEVNKFTVEKEVDTTMVADALRLAAVDAFDIMILISGDVDHTPAVEGVRSLGKQVYVATWEGFGLSWRLRGAAFDHIDLTEGIESFRAGRVTEPPKPIDVNIEDVFVSELARAEEHFSGGFVGLGYFIRKWQGGQLPQDVWVRSRALERLIETGRVEKYQSENGDEALRVSPASP